MNAENGNRQVIRDSGLTWLGIVAVATLLLLSLGGLLYTFLVSVP